MAEDDPMTATPADIPPPTRRGRNPWPRRIAYIVLGLITLLALLILAAWLWLQSDAGRAKITEIANGMDLPRGQLVDIGGLEGNVLGDLSVGSIAVSDVEGVWMTVRDLDVAWNPWLLRDRHMKIEDIRADQVTVLRRPVLQSSGDAPQFRFSVDSFGVGDLTLQDPVAGQFAQFTAEGEFLFDTDGTVALDIDANRLDVPGTSLTTDLSRTTHGLIAGDLVLDAVSGGPVATLLQAPGAVAARGTVRGTPETGSGQLDIAFDDRPVVSAAVDWIPARAEVRADIDGQDWPLLAPLTDRTGRVLDVAVTLDRATRAFDLNANAAELRVDMSGTLPEDGFVPARADIDIATDRAGALIDLPEGYDLGSATVTGTAETEPYAFDGRVAVQGITTPYARVNRLSGPVVVGQPNETTIDYSVDLSAAGLRVEGAPLALADSATLRTRGRYALDVQALTLESLRLRSGEQSATAAGRVRLGETLAYDLSGAADLRIAETGAVPAGGLVAEYAVNSVEGAPVPAVDARGRFTPTTPFAAPLGDLIGEGLAFDIQAEGLGETVLISDARIAGQNLRAAIAGTVGDTLDVSGEAVTDAAIEYAGATVANADISFAATGPRTDPNVRVDARMASASYGERTVEGLRVRAEIRDVLSAPTGPVQIEGSTEYGALMASADLASTQAGLGATDLSLSLGEVSAGGDLVRGPDGLLDGRVALNLPEDGDRYARAVLSLEPVTGEQGVVLNVDAREVSVAGYDFAKITATARGTLAQLSGDIDVMGRQDAFLGRQVGIDTPFALRREAQIYTLTAEPDIAYGEVDIAATAPLTATYGPDTIALDGTFAVEDGQLDVDYLRRGETETLSAALADIPILVLPLPPGVGDTRGKIGANVNLASSPGSAPTGTVAFSVLDWRGFDWDAGEGLNLALNGRLSTGALDFTLVDAPDDDLDLRGEGRVAMEPADSIAGLRPDVDAPLSANLIAQGPLETVFAVIAPEGSDVRGAIDARVRAAGTLANPDLSGQARGTGLGFEAPFAGTRVRNGRFDASFTGRDIAVAEVYAEDAKDGRLNGTGKFVFDGATPVGAITATMNDFRVLDRADYEGRISGDIAYTATFEDSTISGDLKIDRAEIKQINPGGADVVTLDVREIGERDHQNRIVVPQTVIPIKLDLSVRAPRKIFVRARGIELEAELDINIKGTVSEPLITGTARVIRGGYTIAGKSLDFTDGEIVFNGPIPEARIDVSATTETPTLDATVSIKGRVTEPKITLSSTPERPEDEILSTLLFGRSATELTALEAAQLAGALAQLSGAGGGLDLVGGLRGALGLNSLSVGFGEDGSANITGGRYLARNVYLEVFTGGADQSGAQISWEVRRDIILRSRLQADNEQAFSVLYERDF